MDMQYTYKMEEILGCNAESVLLWSESGWLNEIEATVICALLAMAED